MRLKFAIIGAKGYWAKNYYAILKHHEKAEIAWVCDIAFTDHDLDVYRKDGIRAVKRIGEILGSDVNAVIICTPVRTHYEFVKEFMLKGKHILCEKIFTDTSEKANALIWYNKMRPEIKLSVGHTYIHNSIVKYIKEIIDKKELGDIIYIQMMRVGNSPVRPDVPCSVDLMPHDISMLNYWFGEEIETVQTFGRSYLQDGLEDYCVMNIRYKSGMIASLTASWVHPIKERKVTIVGSKKMLSFDDMAKSVTIFEKDGSTYVPDIVYDQPLKTEVNDFIDAILNDREPKVTATDGMSIVEILEMANK